MIIKQTKNELGKHSHSSLSYELALLKERNSLLSQENQNLIEKVQWLECQLHEKLSLIQNLQKEVETAEIVKESCQNLLKKRSKQIIEEIQKQNQQPNILIKTRLKTLLELSSNKISTKIITQNLFDTIQELLSSNSNKIKEKTKLKDISEKLLIRKKAAQNKKIQPYIHMIKEPTYYPSSSSILSYTDIPYLVRLYEKMIIKTKKQQFSLPKVNEVLERIKNTIPLKKKASEILCEVKDLEREHELGYLNPQLLAQMSNIFKKAQSDFEDEKNAIENLINHL